MKELIIIGAGTGGTMLANKFRKSLENRKWNITIVDKDEIHYYQPGFLFIPFGIYKKCDVVKSKAKFLPAGVNYIVSEVEIIEGDKNQVILKNTDVLKYDYLIIATGTRIVPKETLGLKEDLWYKNIFDFYTIEGAVALADFFETWKGGELVINIAEMPIKCPVAPLEFAFHADAFFTKKGIRDKVNISYVTPLSGAFTKPRASKVLGNLLVEKNIHIIPDYNIAEVNNAEKKIIDYAGLEVPFDCLVTIPVHMGDEVIIKSGIGDDLGFIKTNKKTMRSEQFENIFVIGDAANIPTSKAGSVVHFSAEVVFENLMCAIEGRTFTAEYDGHSNCYIETGFGKGALIDFNYETEPLTGLYPLPVIGPFALLKESKMNHIGKMLFRWIYWNILLKGRVLPVDSKMNMKGKVLNYNN